MLFSLFLFCLGRQDWYFSFLMIILVMVSLLEIRKIVVKLDDDNRNHCDCETQRVNEWIRKASNRKWQPQLFLAFVLLLFFLFSLSSSEVILTALFSESYDKVGNVFCDCVWSLAKKSNRKIYQLKIMCSLLFVLKSNRYK